MGLDMYLNTNVYIGGKYEHRHVEGEVKITIEGQVVPISVKDINTIIIESGYWRKANAVHGWFVKNVQNGEDDCRDYEVSLEQLRQLKAECEKALQTGDGMEPVQGFFFGTYEKDEGWKQDMVDTIKIVDHILAQHEHYPKGAYVDYEYNSSW